MSQIEKLSIQGIRSYGTEDKDRVIITFFKPLTLILGPNGTGKTTIIECLKYMTTGEVPSGAKTNGAFVNDPKISMDSESKAQVRLQFRDMQGLPCIAQRSLSAIQKKDKVEMKTLEALIQKKAKDGSTMQLSSRCAETNGEMISLLGVSKPILENVIFCHQEDSNWPLTDGKALKQKFDDIFASTRYVKALDVLRKIRMEKNALVKEYNSELKYLVENKNRFKQVHKRLEELQSRRDVCIDGMNQTNKILAPLVDKLDMLESQEEDVRRISNIIAKLEGEKNQVKKLIEGLKNNIKEPFEGSVQELDGEINGFKRKLAIKEENLKENEDQVRVILGAIKELQKDKSKVDREQATLQQDFEREEKTLAERNTQLKSLAKEYSIDGGVLGGEVSKDDAKSIINSLQQHLEDMACDLNNSKEEFSREMVKLQREMDVSRDEKMRLETEKSLKEQTLSSNSKEAKDMEKRLSRMDQSMARLNKIDAEMHDVTTKLSSLKSKHNVEELQAVVAAMQDERNQYNSAIRSLDNQLQLLHEDTATRSQLNVYNKEKSSKEANIKRLFAKNGDSLTHIMGEIPEHDIKKKLDDYIRNQSKRVNNMRNDVSSLKQNLTKLATTHKINKERLECKEEEAREIDKRLAGVTGGEDLTQGLKNLASKLQAQQDNKGNLLAIDYMFKNYLSKLQKPKPDCPLCHRPFDEQSEVDELVAEMEGKLQLVPEKLERVKEAITDTSKIYDEWIQLKPLKESLTTCKEEEIPKIEKTLVKLSKEISDLSTQVTEREEELEADSNDESVAKSILPDATIIDKLMLDIRELEGKINKQSGLLKNDKIEKSAEEVQKEKTSQMMLLDALVGKLENRQREIQRVSSDLHKQQQRQHELRSERLKIEEELRERLQLEENVKELKSTNSQLTAEIRKAQDDLKPVVKQIEKLIKERKAHESEYERERSNRDNNMKSLSNKLSNLKQLNDELKRYQSAGLNEKLKECTSELMELSRREIELEKEKNAIVEEIDAIKSELALQKEKERDLEDNKLLMEKMAEVAEMNKRMNEENKKLGEWDLNNLQKEKNEVKTQAEAHHRKIEAMRIRKTHAEGEISSLKGELETEALKDAPKKYNDMQINIKTTEIACEDLDKYYKVLDKSIMSYHSSKMAELNKIIRDLWRTTYKGEDIDTIEIRSDEDQDSGAGKLRRTYKYRVVMQRANVEMDMKGRCSAGQKVLASLIIRLALAETFCVNCGVLALDEPTTNLDRANIESLAYALYQIIKARSKQKNFQLIVITHDEDFVELLGRSEFVDEYYTLAKEPYSGKSMIKKVSKHQLG